MQRIVRICADQNETKRKVELFCRQIILANLFLIREDPHDPRHPRSTAVE